MRVVRGLAVRAGEVDGRVLELRATRGTAAACRCARAWARPARRTGAGTPTPVSRFTWASSQARGEAAAGSAHAAVGRRELDLDPQLGADLGRELGDLARFAQVGLGAARAPRAARRCRARRPVATGVINETFCSDFALRTAASTSPVDLEHQRIAAGERGAAPRPATTPGGSSPPRTTTTPLRSRTA